jgi:hypothetical protein
MDQRCARSLSNAVPFTTPAQRAAKQAYDRAYRLRNLDRIKRVQHEYRRTHRAVKQAENRRPLSVIRRDWSNIRRRCTGLDPTTPLSWGLPFVDRETFTTWALANPDFWRLYDQWVAHDYAREWSASIDRLLDDGGYTLDPLNMQYLVWHENQSKPHPRQRVRSRSATHRAAISAGLKKHHQEKAAACSS